MWASSRGRVSGEETKGSLFEMEAPRDPGICGDFNGLFKVHSEKAPC